MENKINKIRVDGVDYEIEDTYARENSSNFSNKKVTYSELVSLRDNSELVPGQKYRITDYVTTTTQGNTKSAGHQFDIVIEALTENTLSEDVKACLHEGDDYFKDCIIEAWKIRYDIDNNKDKYSWADTENGKGVIYRMIDEFENVYPSSVQKTNSLTVCVISKIIFLKS